MSGQPAGLLRVLSDKAARIDERDDAAIDLGEFEGEEVERGLLAVAHDSMTDDIVRGSCGESLGLIW